MVAPCRGEIDPASAFQEKDMLPGFGKHGSRNPAPGSGANNYYIIVRH